MDFSPGCAFWYCASFQLFCQHCVASVAPCFFAVCSRRQFGVSCRASPFGAAPIQVFLASSPCAASASSYHFSSSASPPWRSAFSQFAPVVKLGFPVLASGSNRAVKPTCLRQAAYFRSLACEKPALFKPMLYSPAFTFSSVYSLGFGFLAGLRLLVLRQFQTFFASIAPPPWRTAFSRFALVVNLGLPVLASGSNRAVKPTRLRRAAYFRR